jgi:ribonuclease HII
MRSTGQSSSCLKTKVSDLLYSNDGTYHKPPSLLIGVDEAGRGALAGPVVVAAVALDYRQMIAGINDSKKLSPARREELFEIIISTSRYHIAEVGPSYIDRHNILRSTLWGMREAISAITSENDLCLVDGLQIPADVCCECRPIVRGDSIHACIAAASILAKVHRDRIMRSMDPVYPLYGFADHKGYGTARHLKAILEHGSCAIHRKTFAPMANMVPVAGR